MPNSNHWRDFYLTDAAPKKESDFARFLVRRERPCSVVDIGCGNGRDSKFFHEKGFDVIGIDPNSNLTPDFLFLNADISSLPEITSKICYCRFLLHAITEKEQSLLLSWAQKYCKKLYIECRSDKAATKYAYGEHFRRLVNSERLLEDLAPNWKMEHFEEKQGLSVCGQEDPVIIRAVARRAIGKDRESNYCVP